MGEDESVRDGPCSLVHVAGEGMAPFTEITTSVLREDHELW